MRHSAPSTHATAPLATKERSANVGDLPSAIGGSGVHDFYII